MDYKRGSDKLSAFRTHPLGNWYEIDVSDIPVEERDEVWGSKVLARFYGNEEFPIEWENETEKKVHWVLSELHNPHPASALYSSLFGWWDGPVVKTPEYMYRRFWAPIGTLWPAKLVNGYLYHGIVPPDPETIEAQVKYYNTVMPVYADKYLDIWKERDLPEIKRNLEYLDNFPYEESTLERLLLLWEDAIDIFDKHFKIHWILNLAQFQAFLTFKQIFGDVFGEVDEVLAGRILLSIEDRNWDSLNGMYNLKETIKKYPEVRKIVENRDLSTDEIREKLEDVKGGKEFLRELNDFLDEFGWKSIYTHCLRYPSWKEDPLTLFEQLRGFLVMDYVFSEDIERTKKDQADAIKEMWERAEKEGISEENKAKLRRALTQATNMAPLTPDHHFYIDQGTHQRMRRAGLEIGKKFVEKGILEAKEDIIHFSYPELREIATNPAAFDAKAKVEERKKSMKEAEEILPPPFIGTVTDWSLHQEPYKQGLWGWGDEKLKRALERIEMGLTKEKLVGKIIIGTPAAAGVAEGIARIVKSPEEFDRVDDGSVLVCDMTNPAWVSVFPKLKAVVTNSGGVLAHPAIVSREFGIPCVVGTEVGTRQIKDGQRIRVNGNTGEVEILD